jgi:predicted Rdx family selenoprotein
MLVIMDIEIKRCFVWRDIRKEAVSLRNDLSRSLGVTPKIRFGGFGQFDVMVDGKVVFSKKQAGRSPTAAEIVRFIKPAWLPGADLRQRHHSMTRGIAEAYAAYH